MASEAKIEYIFKAVDVAKISLTDFSRLTGISRETLYRWKDGRNITDKLRLDLAYTVATRMEKACRLGKLPLTDRLEKEQRVVVLRKIIREMASK
jgi:hypothetical protein